MSKSHKPAILFILVAATAFIILLFMYVRYKLEIDLLKKEKVNLTEVLKAEKNSRLRLTARYQVLASEDRICTYASDRLGMIFTGDDNPVMFIDGNEIKRINNIISKKYEH